MEALFRRARASNQVLRTSKYLPAMPVVCVECGPKSGWRNLDIRMNMLAPGTNGAVPTCRFMMYREGLQECETRLFIEKAIFDKKISGELAKRCQALLDKRFNTLRELDGAFKRGTSYGQKDVIYEKFLTADWQDLTDRLYAAAADVAKALAK